jgi:hypothetical protein
MKPLLLLLLAPALAHAVTFEVGSGLAHTKDIGDGVWQQQGVAVDHERLNSPAFVAGVTGDFTSYLSWHADYVYSGTITASCLCVGDEHYNAHTHVASAKGSIPFNGFGHTQGVMLTLEPHFDYRGIRFGMEAGPWVYWATWHESRNDPQFPDQVDMGHVTRPQIGAVAGLSIGVGDSRIVYRYFYQRQQWNPFPALQGGMHMITFEKRF